MRIAVLSDIHGNIYALDAVLADIQTKHVSLTVNLGDILSGGVHPKATASRLMPLKLPTIRGNHERQLLEEDILKMGSSDRFARSSITPQQLDWVRSLPSQLPLPEGVLMFHGTPARDDECFLETVTNRGMRAASRAEIDDRAGNPISNVMLCGHTHIQRAARCSAGRLIVNPGSVGLQAYRETLPFPHSVECGSPHARYAVIELINGEWTATFHQVEYDWDRAAMDAETNGFPDYAIALRTGSLR